MKTTIEMHGFEIVIEETEAGLLTVSALKDGDVVEEFTLEGGEDHPGFEGEESEGGEEIKGFGEFGQGEEEDFESETDAQDEDDMDGESDEDESDDDEEDFEEELEEEEEAKLESFQSFINKKRK